MYRTVQGAHPYRRRRTGSNLSTSTLHTNDQTLTRRSKSDPSFSRVIVSVLCFLALVPFPLFTDGGNVTLSEWRPLWNAADDRL